jgi:hypothetical protein
LYWFKNTFLFENGPSGVISTNVNWKCQPETHFSLKCIFGAVK